MKSRFLNNHLRKLVLSIILSFNFLVYVSLPVLNVHQNLGTEVHKWLKEAYYDSYNNETNLAKITLFSIKYIVEYIEYNMEQGIENAYVIGIYVELDHQLLQALSYNWIIPVLTLVCILCIYKMNRVITSFMLLLLFIATYYISSMLILFSTIEMDETGERIFYLSSGYYILILIPIVYVLTAVSTKLLFYFFKE